MTFPVPDPQGRKTAKRVAPWTSLHAQVHRTLRQRRLLQPQQRLLLAVSGGQDSLCLARLMLDLQPKWDWQLAIVHCDHRWRSDSQANARHIEQLALLWQLPFYLEQASTISTTEAEARQWRYHVMTQLAHTHHYTAVLTGHTQSDVAETLVFNLLRGSGVDGLQALTWQRPLTDAIALVRPLLGLSRQQTATFCQDFQLPIWEDATNNDLRYSRNRIRHELLPYLTTHFNFQVEAHLAQTAELLRADVAYLEAIAAQLYTTLLVQDGRYPDRRGLQRSPLQSAPLALQRRVIRQLLQDILPTAPNYSHVEAAIHLLAAPNRSRSAPFPGGMIAEVQGSVLWFLTP